MNETKGIITVGITGLVALLLVGSVFALQEGIGASNAVVIPSFQVVKSPINPLSIAFTFLSIATRAGTNIKASTAQTFFPGDPITFQFGDVITFANIECSNAGFVMERYKSGIFQPPALKSPQFSISGTASQEFGGSVTDVAGAIGTYTVVGYMWCDDVDFRAKNPDYDPIAAGCTVSINSCAKISKGAEEHKTNYDIIEKTASCTLPDEKISSPYCAEFNNDVDVVQDIRQNCVIERQLVSDCTNDQFCSGGACGSGTSGSKAAGEPVAGSPPSLNEKPLSKDTIKDDVFDTVYFGLTLKVWLFIGALVLLAFAFLYKKGK